MNHNTTITKTFIALVLLITLTNTSSALGIMPSGRLYDYQEGQLITQTITVLTNTQEQDQTITLSLSGTLAPYAQVQETITIPRGSTQANTSITLQVPPLTSPGEHELIITAKEQQSSEQSQSIGAQLTVTSTLRVRVPYPDSYLETTLQSKTQDEQVTLTLSTSNRGTQHATANTNINILNPHEELITTLHKEHIIPAQSNTKQDFNYKPTRPGIYQATATTQYNKSVSITHTSFTYQEQRKVLLENISISKQNNLVQANITLTNNWNTDINELYTSITIKNLEQDIVTITTPTSKLSEQEHIRHTTYEQANLVPGTYQAVIEITADNTKIAITKTLIVTEYDIYFEGEEHTQQTRSGVLQAIIIITLAIILLITAYALHTKKK